MTLIVEDGTGVEDAEALCTVAEANTYHDKFGNGGQWNTMDNTGKEVMIRRGYEYMLARYAGRWPDDIFGVVTTDDVGAVPLKMAQANALMALKAKTGALSTEVTPQKIRTKVGPLETEYAVSNSGAAGGMRSFPDVDGMVVPFLADTSPYSMKLERS